MEQLVKLDPVGDRLLIHLKKKRRPFKAGSEVCSTVEITIYNNGSDEDASVSIEISDR